MWIKNPSGRVVSVPDDNPAVELAKAGRDGWSIASDPIKTVAPKPAKAKTSKEG